MLNVIPRKKLQNQTPKTYQSAPENIFDIDNETGMKVIQYLHQCGEKYTQANQIFINYNQPTVEAYEAEISLIEAIRQREAKQISGEALKTILDHYIKTHSPNADLSPDKWTGDDVPLYYIRFLLNGEELEAYTANIIQVYLISAMWQTITPEGEVRVMKL